MAQYNYNQDDEQISAQAGSSSPGPVAESSAENGRPKLNDAGESGSGAANKTKTRKPTKRTQRAGSGEPMAQRPKRSGGNGQRGRRPSAEGIIELPLRQSVQGAEIQQSAAADQAILSELEAQGFTEDEAYHLIHVSDRIANSRETREAEAVIRRLRFNRWLFEQGKLSEFSA
jgi:hypothetical protein